MADGSCQTFLYSKPCAWTAWAQRPTNMPELLKLCLVLVVASVAGLASWLGHSWGRSHAGPSASLLHLPASQQERRISFPRLIHQTVANKSQLSCQHLAIIDSWKRLNPGWKVRLWDDAEADQLVTDHYPHLRYMYRAFLSPAERADMWRILVLHKYGGVYVDSDVQCMQPIATWGAEYHHDASVLLGWESPDSQHVTNWAMAAVPGHPFLMSIPHIMAASAVAQLVKASQDRAFISRDYYEAGIINRTGPGVLKQAVLDWFRASGNDISNISTASIQAGLSINGGEVRVLPLAYFSLGWEVAAARAKGGNVTCADVLRKEPRALVCHQFWGTWKRVFYFPQQFTFPPNC